MQFQDEREILCQMEKKYFVKSFPTQRPKDAQTADTLQLSYLPQMLAEYIQYKYIYPTDTCYPTQRPKGA